MAIRTHKSTKKRSLLFMISYFFPAVSATLALTKFCYPINGIIRSLNFPHG